MVKLLIIDDEEDIRTGIRNCMDWASNGIEVIGEAEDGAQALQLIMELNPDILLMDIQMPEMSGLQVIEAIAARQHPAKSIILSGYDDFAFAKQALKYGVSDYLLKPCMPEEIMQTVLKVKSDIQHQQAKKQSYDLLDARYNESLPFMKEQFLTQLLLQESQKDSVSVEHHNWFHLQIDMKQIVVSLIRIDQYASLLARHDQMTLAALRMKAKTMASDIIGTASGCEIVDHKQDFILLSNAASSLELTTFAAFLDTYKKHLSHLFDSTVSMGISTVCADLSHLHNAYIEADASLAARFHLGTDRIIWRSELNNAISHDGPYPLIQEKQLLTCLKVGNPEELQTRLDDFFLALCPERSSQTHIVQSCKALLLSAYHICLDTNTNTEDIFSQGIASIDQLHHIDTLQQLKERLYHITSAILKKINTRKSGNKIIESALKYMNENYDKDLNLDIVSSTIYVNPRYFCLLFKQVMGINFIDYIHKIRIEKACEKLKQTHDKTYEVASKVGYANEKYFCQIFKKHTGMTPTQYRESS